MFIPLNDNILYMETISPSFTIYNFTIDVRLISFWTCHQKSLTVVRKYSMICRSFQIHHCKIISYNTSQRSSDNIIATCP